MPTVDSDKLKDFSKKIDALNKKWAKQNKLEGGVDRIRLGSSLPDAELISTGNPALDWGLGGGIPEGTIIELYGAPSTGKTTTMTYIMAEVQKRGKLVIYYHTEESRKPAKAWKLAGVDENLVIYIDARRSGEDGINIIKDLLLNDNGLPNDLIGMIVIDSISALAPNAEMNSVEDNGMEGITVGRQAALTSKMFRVICGSGWLHEGCIIGLVNQERAQIGQTPLPNVTSGGKCFGIDTPILMYDSSIKKVQDVVAEDLLMGPDGESRKVLSTTHGVGMLYKIAPAWGNPFTVNGYHILSLKDKDNNTVHVSVNEFLANKLENERLRLYRANVGNPSTPILTAKFYIEKVGVGDYYGFDVGDDHLFLLGDKTVVHNSIPYYAKIRVQLRAPKDGYILDEQKQVIGHTVEYYVSKNNTGSAPPFRRGSWKVIYDKGIDYLGPMIEEALTYGIIKETARFRYVVRWVENGKIQSSDKIHGKTAVTNFVESGDVHIQEGIREAISKVRAYTSSFPVNFVDGYAYIDGKEVDILDKVIAAEVPNIISSPDKEQAEVLESELNEEALG